MKTPGQPKPGLFPTLYGGAGSVINRRALLTGGLLLPLAARAGPAPDLLDRAIAAMGGRAKLLRVKALNWTGTAHVTTGERKLEIEVKTRVEPFVRARSETQLAGTTDTRTLIIEPDGGFVERDAERKPLPPRQTEHERQQYGLYGYLLLVLAPTRAEGGHLVAERRGLPPVTLLLEGDAVMAADYAVAAPDGDATIAQRFLLEGELRDRGIRWPQTITIVQDGKPYFTLDIDTFSVELA